MKILAVTDIHGIYKIVEEIILKESPDLLIVGGDLTTVGSVREAEEAVRAFQLHCKNVLCIAGNMDLPQHDDLFTRLGVGINARGIIYKTIGFFGVSAAPHSPLRTPYEITEEEIAGRLHGAYKDIGGGQINILVSHTPPFGTRVDITHSGIHVGSMAVRDFIEEVQPDLVICGHIHEARGQDTIENSKIINCGTASRGYYAIITIAEKKINIQNLEMHSTFVKTNRHTDYFP